MASESLQPAPEESFVSAHFSTPVPRGQLLGWAGVLLLGPLLLAAAPFASWLNMPWLHSPLFHFLIGLLAAVAGVGLALLVLHVARRARDGRVFLVGLAFLAMASIFFTHAVATPNILISGRNLAATYSAMFSLWLGSAFFALSGLNLSAQANARLMRAARWIVLLFFVFWLLYNWLFLVVLVEPPAAQNQPAAAAPAGGRDDYGAGYGNSEAATPAPAGGRDDYGAGYGSAPAEPAHDMAMPSETGITASASELLGRSRPWVVAVGVACYLFAVLRLARLYRQTPSQFGLALVCGAALFGEALLTQFYAVVFSPLFWLYHVQESFGFGMISYAVLVGYWRGHSRESLIDSLLLSGTRARLQTEYIEAMDALVDALAHGDRPTPELRAMLRERAGLAEGQVQVFERAARAIADERRQRKQLEELNAALRQLEMHKTQLTQMVVHDLKNPLTALIAYLEVLSISALSQDQHELLTGALRSSRNLSALIGDLLDIARLEEGQLELEMSTFAVHDLLRECVDSMDIWLQQEHKSIEVHAPTATLLLDADLRLLRRVLANLLSNAIKHTPPGTHIRLSAEIVPATADQQAMVAITVADDGPGIPPERLGRIFDRFGSFAEPKNSTRQGSTGLGLTLCRLVAEAHGGAVTVSSSVGEGATFRVLLPSLELPA